MSIRRLPWLLERWIANERKYLSRYNVRLTRLPRLWMKGYLSYAGVLYDTSRLDLYLSDKDQHNTIQIDGSFGDGLRNKYITKQLLAEKFAEHLPETYGLVRRGKLLDSETASLAELADRHGEVLCKPVASGRGKGVYLVESDETYSINGEPADRQSIDDIQSSLEEHLAVERVDQHPFEDAIFDGSLNTMRIVTMIDPDTGDPFLAIAVHRFGTEDSAPVDNWSGGGVVAQIDAETGELSRIPRTDELNRIPSQRDTEIEWLDHHPDTGTRVHGEFVPNWDAVRELVLAAATEFGEMWPYVGWDIALREDGQPVIIEGNRATDVDLLQVFEPLLADERRRKFYEHHDIV